MMDYSLIPHGDMPGDKIEINEGHVAKAKLAMEKIDEILSGLLEKKSRVIISVCGGSGVGKSETAALIGYFLNEKGIGTYVLSGDNYPKRFPSLNDEERILNFRNGGIKALVKAGLMDEHVKSDILNLQAKEQDADWNLCEEYSFLRTYIEGGLISLKSYLGTNEEIDFHEINDICKSFKNGSNAIYLKRMGRNSHSLWYDQVDFTDKKVLLIEWTHGNSDYLTEVDIPVFLNSTPKETMEHRALRNRDGKVDSAFVTRVLEIEQDMLKSQAKKAKIIISKSGELLSYDEYKAL